MINKILKEIISLDQATTQELNTISQATNNLIAETQAKVERDIFNTVTKEEKKEHRAYEQKLEDAQHESELILEEATQECENLQQKYENIRKPLAKQVVIELLTRGIDA